MDAARDGSELMSTSYVIAKFVDDLGRNEPRNVGVIAYDGEGAHARFDGEDDEGKMNLTTVRYRIPATRTYKAWVNYWRHALSDPERIDAALRDEASGSQHVLERLVETASEDFYLERGGTVLLDLDELPLEDATRYLFERLVREPEPPAPKSLRQRSEDALKLAGAPMEDAGRFKRDVAITLDVDGTSIPSEVSFAVQNGQWHYLQEVSFDPGKPRFSRKEANNAAFTLEHGPWSKHEGLVLYDQSDVAMGQYRLVEMLMQFGTVINVSNAEHAAERLHHALGLDSHAE